ncbi:MAG TPA: response regulator transcription factor [Prolixibacteraceae bacterium]|jgi:DNA-binding NarL/FixJ family response regulator
MNRPSIILVDDHLLFREGIKLIIKEENIAHVIGEASNGIELLELLSHDKPDLVIMDIDMPQMNGIEATQKALNLFPDLKIIVYTMFGEKEYVQKMSDLGVKAFMLKSNGIAELEKVINDVFLDKPFLPENIPKIMPPLPFQ